MLQVCYSTSPLLPNYVPFRCKALASIVHRFLVLFFSSFSLLFCISIDSSRQRSTVQEAYTHRIQPFETIESQWARERNALDVFTDERE